MIAPGLGREWIPTDQVPSRRAEGWLTVEEALARVQAGETLGTPAPLPTGPAEILIGGPMAASDGPRIASRELGRGDA